MGSRAVILVFLNSHVMTVLNNYSTHYISTLGNSAYTLDHGKKTKTNCWRIKATYLAQLVWFHQGRIVLIGEMGQWDFMWMVNEPL